MKQTNRNTGDHTQVRICGQIFWVLVGFGAVISHFILLVCFCRNLKFPGRGVVLSIASWISNLNMALEAASISKKFISWRQPCVDSSRCFRKKLDIEDPKLTAEVLVTQLAQILTIRMQVKEKKSSAYILWQLAFHWEEALRF